MLNNRQTQKKASYDDAPHFLPNFTSREERTRYYVNKRWNEQYDYYSKKADLNRVKHQQLQIFIAIVAVLVPVLLGFTAGLINWARAIAVGGVWSLWMWQIPMNWLIREDNIGFVIGFINAVPAILSGLVAGATALENVMKYGDNWRAFQSAADGLERERALFEANAGLYRTSPAAHQLFIERSEDVIAQEFGRYIARQEAKGEDDPDDNDEVDADDELAAFQSMTASALVGDPSDIPAPAGG